MTKAGAKGRGGAIGVATSRAEFLLSSTQRITHLGSWEWDVRTNVVTWSDELYRIYGLEPRSIEITYEIFLSKLHPDDRETVQREVGRALERGAPFAYPERIFRPDGTMRNLDTIGDVVRDETGAIVGLIGTCRDVTDERKRDEKIRLYADIVRNMQAALSVWTVGDPADPSTIRLAAANPAADRVARTDVSAFVGKPLSAIAPYAAGGRVEAILAAVARDREVHHVLIERSRDPGNPNRALDVKAFPLPGNNVGVAIEDVTERMVAQRLKDAEQHVLERIAEGAPVGEILASLARVIEDHSPPAVVSIHALDAESEHLVDAAAPSLPPELRQALSVLALGARGGCCGVAAEEMRAVAVEDIEIDPLGTKHREAMREHGLRACWATPILAQGGHVLGTFTLFYSEPRAPTADDVALMSRASHIAGIAIQRHELEEELRELSARADSVREDERAGIAREIHDELGQSLTALKMDVAWIARRLTGDTVPVAEVKTKLDAMSKMIDGVIDEVRRISAELRPGVLEDLGLLAALESYAEETEARAGIVCEVTSNVGDAPFDRGVSTAIFRIFQEALTNVVRHAQATRVDVRLASDGATLSLEVVDDGRGMSPDAARRTKALGLVGARERARRLGGTVSVTSAPGKGTRLFVVVPLPRKGAS